MKMRKSVEFRLEAGGFSNIEQPYDDTFPGLSEKIHHAEMGLISPGRPGHLASPKDVDMEVGNRLSSLRTIIHDEAKAFSKVGLASDACGRKEKMADKDFIRFSGLGDTVDPLLGNDEEVGGRLGIDIPKGNAAFILVDDVGGEFASDYFFKNGRFGHEGGECVGVWSPGGGSHSDEEQAELGARGFKIQGEVFDVGDRFTVADGPFFRPIFPFGTDGGPKTGDEKKGLAKTRNLLEFADEVGADPEWIVGVGTEVPMAEPEGFGIFNVELDETVNHFGVGLGGFASELSAVFPFLLRLTSTELDCGLNLSGFGRFRSGGKGNHRIQCSQVFVRVSVVCIHGYSLVR